MAIAQVRYYCGHVGVATFDAHKSFIVGELEPRHSRVIEDHIAGVGQKGTSGIQRGGWPAQGC